MKIFDLAVPLIVVFTLVYAVSKGVDVYSVFVTGAKRGISVVFKILPGLVAMLSLTYMIRVSGLLDALGTFLGPVLSLFGIPPETVSILLIRPLSGSGAFAAAGDLIGRFGPDSYIGRTAAVMLGSTETTFYTISVYFGSRNIKDTRYAIPAALTADLAGFAASALFARLL